ncbi:MAG: hypothetical protein NT126_08080 [Bacteroidetes bacterium]|nr:hypothetical protein [Bacteroidota bacterium]
MIKTTTLKDLVLYAYNETNLSDSDRIQRNIDGDPLVQQEYKEITEVFKALNEQMPGPSEKSMEKILAFSKESLA